MTNEIFREKMKIFLKSKKITQKALAEQLGVKSFQVNNIISGRERLGLKNAQRFAEILGIDPLWLMTQGEQGTAPDETSPPPPTAPDDAILSVYRLRGRCGCAGLWRFHVTSLSQWVTHIDKAFALVAGLVRVGTILCA